MASVAAGIIASIWLYTTLLGVPLAPGQPEGSFAGGPYTTWPETTSKAPVGLALYGRSNRKSGITPEAEYSGIDTPTRGVVNIKMIMR
eukprot:6019667-Pleurochrysis_carterae.AAC.3